VARYHFTLIDEKPLNGRKAYEMPSSRNGPPRLCTALWTGSWTISGIVWIDAEEFEIAHAEINLGSESICLAASWKL
jgi:hypothetical protein